MDIGIIILIVIASLIGNVFKQSKRQGEGRRNQNNSTPKNEWPPFSPFGPGGPGQPDTEAPRQRAQQSKPVFRKINAEQTVPQRTVSEVKRHDEDQPTTMENRRMDIGSTYESQDVPDIYLESSVKEDKSSEYVKVDNREINNHGDGIRASIGSGDLEIRFDEESLIKGIIMTEVLSPPKCRR